MVLAPKLHLRQTQSLVMTPQLLQSIRLLQMTHLELTHFLDSEIERNPLLERQEDGDRAGEWREQEATGKTGNDSPADNTAEAISGKLDASLENLFPDDPGTHDRIGPDLSAQWKSAGGNGLQAAGGGSYDLEDTTAAARTLRDHVNEQIALAFTDPAQVLIAHELAEGLDEAGYMLADLDEIAERIGAARPQMDAVLATCQTLDPPGLFARNLAECLALQLIARDRYDPAMRAMVDNLDLLAKRDFQALGRLCGVDAEDLADMLAEIRTLDPKPGMAFSTGTADPVVPDVIVKAASDGGWSVELNPETLPRVLVNEAYYARVSTQTRDDDRHFLTECLQNANWLARSLDQRAKTILKVASEIVRQQDAFLVGGVSHLRPLNLRTVADAIGMHESTVSRVTVNKYVMTPRGTFELRYFFSSALASASGGDAHSSEAVRGRIRQLIDEERPDAVLSDDALVDMLRGEGIDIARRTVAKYREALNIPSSVQRRREKKMLAAAARGGRSAA
ncbi:RNA polymerase factor sigma-54 [Nitratireductor pacificus]|uniref:RNA polymerase sigma-54 factor n=1 Tax=Nitratireductor pacificus pht-3B TaxID=391937 RepID=K2MCY4_9HYPH|nr:RNA polymerase factor sigma-54 [Nitratireductor pacificus]EKF20061.1 RNA polymerase factor sigma-54 [Nitratireductor pacificus pht-3B]